MAITFEQVIDAARNSFCDVDVSSVVGTRAFQINLEGKGANGIFYIEIKDNRVSVEPYEYYDRNAVFHISAANFMKLLDGKLDPIAAFTLGKIKVDGDLNAALEMIKFLK